MITGLARCRPLIHVLVAITIVFAPNAQALLVTLPSALAIASATARRAATQPTATRPAPPPTSASSTTITSTQPAVRIRHPGMHTVGIGFASRPPRSAREQAVLRHGFACPRADIDCAHALQHTRRPWPYRSVICLLLQHARWPAKPRPQPGPEPEMVLRRPRGGHCRLLRRPVLLQDVPVQRRHGHVQMRNRSATTAPAAVAAPATSMCAAAGRILQGFLCLHVASRTNCVAYAQVRCHGLHRRLPTRNDERA